MQFLKTLFWVVLAIVLSLWGRANWSVVQVKLWGGLIADIRLPLLILFGFLLGWVPTLLVYRAKMWSLRRRYEPIERNAPLVAQTPVAAPVTVSNAADPARERVATDSEAWPTSR
jgi:lipopolysaccharide assembly protein A